MIATIPPRDLPSTAGNQLYLDYIAGSGTAGQFFTHGPTDFGAALAARRAHRFPRREIVPLLAAYNANLGASQETLTHIEMLSDPDTFCVITGQQVGFLGGPAYTAFKIATTIRLAAYLESTLPARFVPVFWLASEDHDFGEINHTYLLKRDGEVGRVAFDWEGQGRPVAALPVGEGIERALEDYWSGLQPGAHLGAVREAFAPRQGEDYTTWHARIWSKLFSSSGLVIVEPRTLRPAAAGFVQSALQHSDEIRRRLDTVSGALTDAGYVPQLTSASAGQLYTFDKDGFRVRVDEPQACSGDAATHPERYSTDAALRPLFADALLPVVASVLGPGETAYHAMLRPLYEMFELPQTLLFPRKSYTVVSGRESDRFASYQISVLDVLTETLDVDAVYSALPPAGERALFANAQRGVVEAIEPLRSYLAGIDPSLDRTWEQTLANADRGLSRLRDRAFKARLGQLGFSKGELRRLQNALLPRKRPQERVLPLPHLLNRHGMSFLDDLMSAGELLSFDHQVLTLDYDDV
jgi:bacillithiol synthase